MSLAIEFLNNKEIRLVKEYLKENHYEKKYDVFNFSSWTEQEKNELLDYLIERKMSEKNLSDYNKAFETVVEDNTILVMILFDFEKRWNK